jgi:hypothetical protein
MDLCWVNQKNGGTKHFIGSLWGFARINQQNVQNSVILSIYFCQKKNKVSLRILWDVHGFVMCVSSAYRKEWETLHRLENNVHTQQNQRKKKNIKHSNHVHPKDFETCCDAGKKVQSLENLYLSIIFTWVMHNKVPQALQTLWE